MKITGVKIRKIFSEGKLKAIASITIDDVFAVHDVKVIEGDNGTFLGMPSRKDENGTFRDIVHPIDNETRGYITAMVIAEYEAEKSSQSQVNG